LFIIFIAMSTYRGRSQSRSRGFVNRGRSSGRGNPSFRGRRNFFDEEVEQQEVARVEAKKKQIEEKKKEEVPVVDNAKKVELIEKGKQWFNKFFGGMKKKERANIQIELNDDLDLELYAAYEQKLSSMTAATYYYSENDIKQAPKFMRAYINILLGMKLLKANTADDKGLMKRFQPLSLLEVKVPKNLGIILDCLGKTDAGMDNVVRIIGQNSSIKTCFFKACVDAAVIDERIVFDNMTWDASVSYDSISTFRKNHILKKSKLKMYSADRSGIQLINERGSEAIDYINKMDITIQVGGHDFQIRTPYFDPDRGHDINYILDWEKKISGFFTAIKFEPNMYTKVIGYVLLKWLPLRFIQRRNEKFSDLDSIFEDTIFSALKPVEVLTQDDWYCTDDFLTDEMLYDNIIFLVTYYKNHYQRMYEDNFHMVPYSPSEFGNSAQIVTDHGKGKVWLANSEYTTQVEVTKNVKATSSYIRMNEEEAIIGSVFNFNNNVRFKSGYDINLVGTSSQIRNSFITHDFK